MFGLSSQFKWLIRLIIMYLDKGSEENSNQKKDVDHRDEERNLERRFWVFSLKKMPEYVHKSLDRFIFLKSLVLLESNFKHAYENNHIKSNAYKNK